MAPNFRVAVWKSEIALEHGSLAGWVLVNWRSFDSYAKVHSELEPGAQLPGRRCAAFGWFWAWRQVHLRETR